MVRSWCLLAAMWLTIALGVTNNVSAQNDQIHDPFEDVESERRSPDRAAAAQNAQSRQRRGRSDVTLLAEPPIARAEPIACHCADEVDSPGTVRIYDVLAGPLTRPGFDFPGTPLEEVVDYIQDEYDIPIQIDTTTLDAVGIGPDAPVTVNLRNLTLQSALRLILDPLDLTFVVRNEVLAITTRQEAEMELRTCVYAVHELVLMPGGQLDFDSLIDAIVSSIATNTWSENGGVGTIRPLPPGLLVISQTQLVHEEIGGLLVAIRNARRELEHSTKSANRSVERDPAEF